MLSLHSSKYSQLSLQRHCLSSNNLTLKLNFCCNEFRLKLNWYICANTIDVVKNFSVIKNVIIKSFHCTTLLEITCHGSFFFIIADIKLPGAERRSRYYQKYGNPNYGGMRGLISSSK